LTQAIAIGTIWLILTVAFEFFFGRYVGNHPWSRLLADYNLLAGRLWGLVLLAVATLPAAVFLFKS
jgi:ABC-type glycerol-3-phosphate transport system permease component